MTIWLTWKGSAIMRKCFWLFLLVFLFILSAKGTPARADDLQMVSVTSNGQALSIAPVPPGSPLPVVSPGPTTISITFNQPIWIAADPQTYMNAFVVSGQYDYGFFISSTGNTRVSPTDNKTLVLDNVDLPEDDTITVGLREDIAPAGAFSFSFTTPAVTNIKMDPVLEQAIKTTLGIPEGREIYQSEDPDALMPNPNPSSHSEHEPDFVPIPAMDDLTSLTYEYPTSQNNPLPQISSISGLVYADNLQYLNLDGNSIGDLTPLQGLTKLQTLDLDYNDLTDNGLVTANLAPLSNLTQLEQLNLNNCNISDVTGLQGIGSSLTYLDLSQNEISDIGSLSSLTGLQTLYLSTNQITNITPLIDLTSLTYLNLDNNQISDGAPTGSLTALTDLELDSNQLSSIGFLQTLTNLQILHLSTNSIVDITPLKYLTDLQDLNLSDNYLTDDCFQILEENGLWKIADINGKQKFDLLAYESYVKSFLNNASANITILKPSGTTPTNETPLAVGDETKPLELDYNFSNVLSNGHMPNFDDLQQFEQYLSQIKVYVNGAYDEELTGSLSFDTEGSTLNPDSELTLILDHTIPFPDASTITVDVPQLLFLNGGRPL